MGTTPTFGIPYADPTDHVAEFPATDQAAAVAIEGLLKGTEATITWTSPYRSRVADPLRIIRRGNVLMISGGWEATGPLAGWGANQQLGIGTVPPGFRPSSTAGIWSIPGNYTVANLGYYRSALLIASDGGLFWQASEPYSGQPIAAGNVYGNYRGHIELA